MNLYIMKFKPLDPVTVTSPDSPHWGKSGCVVATATIDSEMPASDRPTPREQICSVRFREGGSCEWIFSKHLCASVARCWLEMVHK